MDWGTKFRIVWMINAKGKASVFQDHPIYQEWENREQPRVDHQRLPWTVHLPAASRPQPQVPAFNHLLSSAIFPAGLFILCLPASSPGSVQRKENMKVKSGIFTSGKAHNFHVLPLTSIHKLHFSCARHILTLVLLAMPIYVTSFMPGEHLAPLCIQSPAPSLSPACHTSSG